MEETASSCTRRSLRGWRIRCHGREGRRRGCAKLTRHQRQGRCVGRKRGRQQGVEGTDPGGTVRGRRRREARGPATAKGQEDSIGVGEGGDAKVIRYQRRRWRRVAPRRQGAMEKGSPILPLHNPEANWPHPAATPSLSSGSRETEGWPNVTKVILMHRCMLPTPLFCRPQPTPLHSCPKSITPVGCPQPIFLYCCPSNAQ